MQQPFRMPPMGPGQQRPVGPGQPRPTGSLTDVGQRRRPRPTHIWDPERGVIPLDPNAPTRFVPPPTPAVTQAYMQGIARRQGNGQNVVMPVDTSGRYRRPPRYGSGPLGSGAPGEMIPTTWPGAQAQPIPLHDPINAPGSRWGQGAQHTAAGTQRYLTPPSRET